MNEEKKSEKGELEKLHDEMEESIRKADVRIEEFRKERENQQESKMKEKKARSLVKGTGGLLFLVSLILMVLKIPEFIPNTIIWLLILGIGLFLSIVGLGLKKKAKKERGIKEEEMEIKEKELEEKRKELESTTDKLQIEKIKNEMEKIEKELKTQKNKILKGEEENYPTILLLPFGIMITLAGILLFFGGYVFLIGMGAAIFIFSFGIKIIPTVHLGLCRIVDRIIGVKGPGLALVIPFVEDVLPYYSGQHKFIIPPEDTPTSDGVHVKPKSTAFWRIGDLLKAIAIFGTEKMDEGVNERLTTFAREINRVEIAKIAINDVFKTDTFSNFKQEIEQKIIERFSDLGIIVDRIALEDIEPPVEIKDLMEEKREAEYIKLAMITKAEGDKQATIIKAEGQKQKDILEGEGAAKKIEKLAEALEKHPEVLALEQIKGWDGKLPQYILGNSPIPFFNIEGSKDKEEKK